MVEEAILISEKDTVALKKSIATILYQKNFDQVKISEILNISQPMVSNYCSSKVKTSKKILSLAEKISNEIINGKNLSFSICASFSKDTLFGDYLIANKNEIISDDKSKIIDNMSEAFLLLNGKDIGNILPEVKINIAMTKDNAKTSSDVASFLNGLIVIDDKISSNNGIRFGKSKHLSSLLLYLKKDIDVNAIMNIAYIKDAKKTGFKFNYLTKDFKLNNNNEVDLLLHKGDFGIEPCTYILGKDAVDVSKKFLKIIGVTENE
jgi:predicted fused transcriptional regulator/phosphomethylpyrimidine kinase/predicted XRE-type DNA-binding protein